LGNSRKSTLVYDEIARAHSPVHPTHLACRIFASPSDRRIRLSSCLGVALMVLVPLPTMLRMSRYPLMSDRTAGSLICSCRSTHPRASNRPTTWGRWPSASRIIQSCARGVGLQLKGIAPNSTTRRRRQESNQRPPIQRETTKTTTYQRLPDSVRSCFCVP